MPSMHAAPDREHAECCMPALRKGTRSNAYLLPEPWLVVGQAVWQLLGAYPAWQAWLRRLYFFVF